MKFILVYVYIAESAGGAYNILVNEFNVTNGK